MQFWSIWPGSRLYSFGQTHYFLPQRPVTKRKARPAKTLDTVVSPKLTKGLSLCGKYGSKTVLGSPTLSHKSHYFNTLLTFWEEHGRVPDRASLSHFTAWGKRQDEIQDDSLHSTYRSQPDWQLNLTSTLKWATLKSSTAPEGNRTSLGMQVRPYGTHSFVLQDFATTPCSLPCPLPTSAAWLGCLTLPNGRARPASRGKRYPLSLE